MTGRPMTVGSRAGQCALLKRACYLEGHGAADRHRTAAGKCFLGTLGVFPEFETSLRGERQFEGIARASPIAKASSWVARRSIAC
jgi:hypothetical protein